MRGGLDHRGGASVIVVTADHGAGFRPGGPLRTLDRGSSRRSCLGRTAAGRGRGSRHSPRASSGSRIDAASAFKEPDPPQRAPGSVGRMAPVKLHVYRYFTCGPHMTSLVHRLRYAPTGFLLHLGPRSPRTRFRSASHPRGGLHESRRQNPVDDSQPDARAGATGCALCLTFAPISARSGTARP